MDQSLKERLTAEYLAGEPNQENSRSIVRELAKVHSVSEAKVRSALVASGVYIAQPRTAKIASSEQKQAIFDRLNSTPEGTYVSTPDLAKEFGLTWDAVMEVERQWRSEQQPSIANYHDVKDNNSKPVKYVVAGAITLLVMFFIMQNVGTSSNSASDSSFSQSKTPTDTSFDSSESTSGTATRSERDAYSVDLYEKPSGLTSSQNDKYESLSKEGQEYVDEKMAEYDRVCARTNNC